MRIRRPLPRQGVQQPRPGVSTPFGPRPGIGAIINPVRPGSGTDFDFGPRPGIQQPGMQQPGVQIGTQIGTQPGIIPRDPGYGSGSIGLPRGPINVSPFNSTPGGVRGGMGPLPNNLGPMQQPVGDPRTGAAFIPGNRMQEMMKGPQQAAPTQPVPAMKKGGIVRGGRAETK